MVKPEAPERDLNPPSRPEGGALTKGTPGDISDWLQVLAFADQSTALVALALTTRRKRWSSYGNSLVVPVGFEPTLEDF